MIAAFAAAQASEPTSWPDAFVIVALFALIAYLAVKL
jgi:hypothetical protein